MADALGRMIADAHRGAGGEGRHRRDDGVTWPAAGDWYLSDPEAWGDHERAALESLRGRVLDAGCGAGRTARWLADCRGHDVLGLDRSPRALAVARDRGVERVVLGDLTALPLAAGAFDSVLVAGTQLGVAGDREGLRALLAALGRVLGEGGRVVADLFDPLAVEDADRRAYLAERSPERGVATRRFRVEYGGVEGPWIDLLLLSPARLREALDGTPWTATEVLRGSGEAYYAVLDREPVPDE
jgi:SAM-dependent methyltransferase